MQERHFHCVLTLDYISEIGTKTDPHWVKNAKLGMLIPSFTMLEYISVN